MKILLLEDNVEKREMISSTTRDIIPNADIVEVSNWLDYSRQINSKEFDLILLDLLVPRSPKDPGVEDHCTLLVETTRSFESKSFRTPAIVLTQYLDQSEDFFSELNKVDINVISFDADGEWKISLERKIRASQPKVKFDFVIVCALHHEANAYEGLVDYFGDIRTISGLVCREVVIDEYKGAIVLLPRMGLVSSGVISSLAIERFEPRLICMSGICGGIPTKSSIYDILITDTCHQHDIGKWSDDGFKVEHYDIQIKTNVRNKLEELFSCREVNQLLRSKVSLTKSEYPKGMESYSPRINIVATSSGSAVIAEEGKTSSLSGGQRKLAGFDMEVYSVYEAARISQLEPNFFAVKTVVDDGDKNKGDQFHRVGSLSSAIFVTFSIRSGLVDS